MNSPGSRLLPRRRRRTKAVADPAPAATAPTAEPQIAQAGRAPSDRSRGVLIVNPYSSGMTAQRERGIVQTLRDYLDLEVRRTERSGHAPELARRAVADGADIIIACGGDGTANEVLNGMELGNGTASERPAFAIIPAGGTNVFSRSLGLPNHPVRAAAQIATAIAARRAQVINLGTLDERLFLFAAGVGFDGALVRRMDEKRRGRRPSDLSILLSVVGLFLHERFAFDERMTVTIEDSGEQMRAAMLLCGNTAPMSYIGRLPVDFMPDARLDRGLDFVAPRRANALLSIRNALQATGLVGRRRRLVRPEEVQMHTDVTAFLVECDEPQPCQVDGEYLGDRSHVRFGVLRDTVRLVY